MRTLVLSLLIGFMISVFTGAVAAQTPGTGSVTIGGGEQWKYICIPGCSACGAKTCAETVYDSGTVQVTVNGFAKIVSYRSGSTSSLIATALAGAFNSDPGSPVTASVSGSVLTLISVYTGTISNFSLASSVAYNTAYFTHASFTATLSGTTLTGGTGPAPSVTGISPLSGLPGTHVTINGTNLGSSQRNSTVTFNGTAASVASWSPTSVGVTVPVGASTGNVIVTESVTVQQYVCDTCRFIVSPSIASVSPTAAPVGASINILGSNFGAAEGGSASVVIGSTIASITTVNDTSITATVPTGATTGSLIVCVLYGAQKTCTTGPSYSVIPTESLILGGNQCSSTFETLDNSGASLSSGNLANPLSSHSATLLPNWTIFVAGGSCNTTLWEIIDHNTNILSSGLLNDGRVGAFAVLLNNGNIMIGGGSASPGTWEIRTPTGGLVGTGSLNGARDGGQAALKLQSGNVWISGSSKSNPDACTWEIHDTNGALVSSGTLNTCFGGGKALLLANGNVVLLGGDNAPGTYEIYSPTGSLVTTGGTLNAFNHGSRALFLQNGNIFIFGSCAGCALPGAPSTWEIRDASMGYISTGSLLNERDSAGVARLDNGNVLIIGGAIVPGTWEIRSSSGALVSQGSLVDSRPGGQTVTHFQ